MTSPEGTAAKSASRRKGLFYLGAVIAVLVAAEYLRLPVLLVIALPAQVSTPTIRKIAACHRPDE